MVINYTVFHGKACIVISQYPTVHLDSKSVSMLKQKERLFVSYLLWKKAAIRSKNSVAWTLVALVIYRHRKKLMNCMTQIREFHHQMRVKTFHKDQVSAYIG